MRAKSVIGMGESQPTRITTAIRFQESNDNVFTQRIYSQTNIPQYYLLIRCKIAYLELAQWKFNFGLSLTFVCRLNLFLTLQTKTKIYKRNDKKNETSCFCVLFKSRLVSTVFYFRTKIVSIFIFFNTQNQIQFPDLLP